MAAFSRVEWAVWALISAFADDGVAVTDPEPSAERTEALISAFADDGVAVTDPEPSAERTEGSYLGPDTMHGMAYLEAVRDVFGN
ncbi:MAG: hypothetical protein HYV26_10175 [Candidatus Hydrogenedentes bacterium]|nr:hypothetical protein [Candidatus Hydrogenedentota bacterium]